MAALALQRRLLAAFDEAEAAARPEGAALGQVRQRRRAARDGGQAPGPRPVQRRDRIMQPPAIGMPGLGEDVAGRAPLHDAAGIHDHDPVGDLGDDAEIMGDQHDGGAEVAAELLQQLQDLSLHRHIEGRRRLVGDEQRGIAGERHGDEAALAHAARELMGVAVHRHRGIGNPDLAQELDRALAGLAAGEAGMGADLLLDLPADGIDRGQRGHGILEDHGDLAAAHGAELAPGETDELAPLVEDRAADHRIGIVDQPHHAHQRDGLARAGLAHHADDLMGVDAEGDAADGMQQPVLGAEGDREVPHLEQRLLPVRRGGRGGRGWHRGYPREHWP